MLCNTALQAVAGQWWQSIGCVFTALPLVTASASAAVAAAAHCVARLCLVGPMVGHVLSEVGRPRRSQ